MERLKASLSKFLKGPSGPLLESVIYGLVAGLAVVAFEACIAAIYSHTFVPLSKMGEFWFGVLSLALILSTSLVAGVLLNLYAPEAAGSGIPQLKVAFWKDFGYVPFRVAWVKFIAGVLTIGGGCSLGREGPSVQLAGAMALTVSGWLGRSKASRRRAAAAGASAGLAAAFNTPLSAIAFVLEEILGDLNSPFLGSVVAAVFGAFVVHAFLGSHPAFALPPVEHATWIGRLCIPIVALAASFMGVMFQRFSLDLRKVFLFYPLRLIPKWGRPAFGALVTWVIGISTFHIYGRLGVFSLGYDDLSDGFQGKLLGSVCIVLLIGKFAATVFSYGTGGCGGIFAPCLFLGAMTGCAIEEIFSLAGVPLTPQDQLLLMVIGMSSFLGSVVRAPCTSILIVFEMTRQFGLIPELLVGGIFSQSLARWLHPIGFYEQVLVNSGHVINTLKPPRDFREWQDYPVSAIASFCPQILPNLEVNTLNDALELPFSRFVLNGEAKPRVVLRGEIISCLKQGTSIPIYDAVTCKRNEVIFNVQQQLVHCDYGMVVIIDDFDKVVGVVTLHDLLRAHQAFSQRE